MTYPWVSSHLRFISTVCLFSCLCHFSFYIPESNGAGGRWRRGGTRDQAGSPPPAYSAFQSYCTNRKEVRRVLTAVTWRTLILAYRSSSPLSIPVNSIQIIFIWHMQKLWQRWVIAKGFGTCFQLYARCTLKLFFFLSFPSCRVAILVRKKKGERKWWKMPRMRCPLRCDSQNW